MPKTLDHKKIETEARKLRKAGYSYRKIANVVGCTHATVRRICTGIVEREKSLLLKKKILHYNHLGLGFADIAKLVNCSRQYAFITVSKNKGPGGDMLQE